MWKGMVFWLVVACLVYLWHQYSEIMNAVCFWILLGGAVLGTGALIQMLKEDQC